MRGTAALAVLVLMSAGCERPWQTARTVVNAAAEGVAAADVAVVEAYEASDCEGQEDPARLRECIDRLEEQVAALASARDALRVGESLVDGWQQARTEPEEWQAWLTTAAQLAARLVALLESFDVDIPSELSRWSGVLDDYLERGRD